MTFNRPTESNPEQIQGKHRTSNQSLPKLDMKPTTFDRETHWPKYRQQFEAAAECNLFYDEGKATALFLVVRGKALTILPNS